MSTKISISHDGPSENARSQAWWDCGGKHLPTVDVVIGDQTYTFLSAHIGYVKAGAEWLDANFPGWYMNIDTATLDLNSMESCVLGQEFTYTLMGKADPNSENYEAFVNAHFDGDRDKAALFGFDMGLDMINFGNYHIYHGPKYFNELSYVWLAKFWEWVGTLWINEINERKARDERAVDVVMAIAESKPEILDKLGAS